MIRLLSEKDYTILTHYARGVLSEVWNKHRDLYYQGEAIHIKDAPENIPLLLVSPKAYGMQTSNTDGSRLLSPKAGSVLIKLSDWVALHLDSNIVFELNENESVVYFDILFEEPYRHLEMDVIRSHSELLKLNSSYADGLVIPLSQVVIRNQEVVLPCLNAVNQLISHQ